MALVFFTNRQAINFGACRAWMCVCMQGVIGDHCGSFDEVCYFENDIMTAKKKARRLHHKYHVFYHQ